MDLSERSLAAHSSPVVASKTQLSISITTFPEIMLLNSLSNITYVLIDLYWPNDFCHPF
jgi:hypothetical protein